VGGGLPGRPASLGVAIGARRPARGAAAPRASHGTERAPRVAYQSRIDGTAPGS